uniref:NADH dehydrogenase subunit 2 n=1 Tax=Boreoheptagyia alulasetosa TaxID=2851576 RepID=UPI0020290B3C|nr:NADH dehydrogenase subunit 2 [Boreoheptagyia alulasetosa]UQJ73434.1 NADH dehydrogenase subunit 2 [Boreoheptagyia alulasetosa]
MFKNSYKLLFLITLMSGTLITISSTSWFGAWMGLEINLLSFIPLMMNTNNLLSSEASLKYFLTQALASSILLFGVIFFFMLSNWSNSLMENYTNLLISSALLLKSGAAPFHFWFPSVMEGLSWNNSLILMTWQKIAPLMLVSYCFNSNFFIVIILCSILIGSLGGLNQTSLRKLMSFSSINHLGWMIAGMMNSENLWMVYFMFYSFLSFTIVFLFNNFKLFNINQMFGMFNGSSIMKFLMFLSLLSLGGLPPFMGFMPKWLIIESLISMNMFFLLTFMVTFTLITLFFYMRICYAAFLLNHNENNWTFKNFYFNKNLTFSLILTFFSIFGLMMINILYWLL